LYRLAQASGWLRRSTPVSGWQDFPLSKLVRDGIPAQDAAYLSYRTGGESRPVFFYDAQGYSGDRLGEYLRRDEAAIVEEAEEILGGRFRLFGGAAVPLGWPPDWTSVPGVDGSPPAASISLKEHWSSIEIRALPFDIRLLWEPSRFGAVYPLARAYALTGLDRYAECFWTLVESWRACHRPNEGAQWISAQEVALRLMAITFGLHAFSRSAASDAQRVRLAVEMIAVHALRIPASLSYARAQGNNHLLSEAAGLYTAGVLFPELKRASRWRSLGRRWLIRGILQQVDEDGGYVQHSANYHRLLLHLGLWVTRIGDLNGDPFPSAVIRALGRATGVLRAMVDAESGKAPNFGPNDGSDILPLAQRSQEDFRGVIQAAGIAFLAWPLYPPGPWDEPRFWLGLTKVPRQEAAKAPVQEDGFARAGLHFLRGHRTWAMLRCGRFRTRPGHADQLHLDLWRQGANVVLDAGTYLYNGLPPWENALSAARLHNAMLVDGREPMRPGGRFLWLDWDHGEVLGRGRSGGDSLEWVLATRQAYSDRGVRHQRCVIRGGADQWLVVDELLGEGLHRFSLAWLLPDVGWSLSPQGAELHLAADTLIMSWEGPITGTGIYRAGERIGGKEMDGASPTWGWASPSYASKVPTLFIVVQGEGPLPARVVTRFRFGGMRQQPLDIEWGEPKALAVPFRRLAYEVEEVDL
jgi:asparagine synthase (glutamine-hydrolysing)